MKMRHSSSMEVILMSVMTKLYATTLLDFGSVQSHWKDLLPKCSTKYFMKTWTTYKCLQYQELNFVWHLDASRTLERYKLLPQDQGFKIVMSLSMCMWWSLILTCKCLLFCVFVYAWRCVMYLNFFGGSFWGSKHFCLIKGFGSWYGSFTGHITKWTLGIRSL